MILNAGQVVAGRYEVIGKIGSGGMAIVYKAKDMKLDRFVTIKVLKEEHISNDEFKQRFKVEARAVASLNHPNIVNVYDVGNENSVNYIIMEYVDGVTLKELIVKRAPFDDEEVVGVAVQVAAALAHAHKNGVVHRDIKPQNILVTPNGTIKVTDFGIARSANSNTLSISGTTMGSVHYISPEQAKGEAIDVKSDLYSIGILMYEMVTGNMPYDADNPVSIALMHINDPLPEIRETNQGISKNVVGIINHLTEKNPDRRYQSADSLIADLKIALSEPDMMFFGEQLEDDDDYTDIIDTSLEDSFDVDELDDDMYDDEEVLQVDKELEKKVYIAGILTAVAIIIIISIIFLPKLFRSAGNGDAKIKMPNIIGMDFDEAAKALDDLGLEINILGEVSSDIYEANVITEQNYVEGDEVKAGTAVNVLVSQGKSKYEIPNLTKIERSKIDDAKINEYFKIVDTYENSDTVARNVVISQTPEAGEMHDAGTEITLVISKGPVIQTVTVPDVVGMTEADAKTKLKDKGFVVGLVNREPSTRYSEGTVSAQSPTNGKEVYEGTTVIITVSSGPPAASPEPTEGPDGDETPTATPTEPRTYELKCNPYIDPGIVSVYLTVAEKTQNGMKEIYRKQHLVSEFPVYVPITGEGTVEYHMYVNDIDRGSTTIDFSNLPEENNE